MAQNGTACLTVLVVEDFEDSRRMIKSFLEMEDYCVVEAIDGQEAVEIAQQECPDLILMDLNLPQLDGLEATKQIREGDERCKDVPIVAITAHDTYGMKEAALETGCNAYIAKPIDFGELNRVVRQVLSGL